MIAEDRARGEDAADLVVVDYDPLPVVVDPEASARDEVLLFPDVGTNVVMRFASESQADFSGCEVVVSERIVNQRMTAAPIEPRSGAAYWTDDGRLVHYSACQGAHPTRDLLADGLRPGARRRCGWSCPTWAAASAPSPAPTPRSWRSATTPGCVGRPVKWTETRSENMVAMPHGRGQVQHGQDGRHPRRAHHRLPARRGAGRRGLPAHRRRPADDDPAHDHRRLRPRQRRLHRRLGGHQHRLHHRLPGRRPARGGRGDRAHGRPVRRRDRHGPGRGAAAQPRARASPSPTRPASAPPTTWATTPRRMERALGAARLRRAAGRAGRRAGPPATRSRSASASPCTWRSPRACRAASSARSSCSTAAGCVVRSGATPYGQGHETTWAMIVADRTGVPIDQIEVVHGDTDVVRSGGLTVGSRSVQIGGAAIADGHGQARRRGPGAGGRPARGGGRRRGARRATPAASTSPARRPARSPGPTWSPGSRRAAGGRHRLHTPTMPTFPFGAHVAVVEVDTETGHVRLCAARRRRRRRHASSTRCWPRARCTAASPRASPRRCSRRSSTTRTASPSPPTSPTTPSSRPPSCPRSSVVHMETPDLGQRARRQGRRRVGHHRRHPGRLQRRHRRPRPPRRPPPRDPPHPRADLAELR